MSLVTIRSELSIALAEQPTHVLAMRANVQLAHVFFKERANRRRHTEEARKITKEGTQSGAKISSLAAARHGRRKLK
jgi:hypothetical protein